MSRDFYGFSEQPFQLTPDPRFYFDSATHRKAMAYLGYGLAQGEGFIVITGEVGAGKTTLVRHLMATVDPNRLSVAHVATTQVNGSDMLRLAAASFGIASEGADKATLLTRFETFLRGEARLGKRVLLIVDEAQNLPVETLEELRMLSNFQAQGSALLQIFLLGQPEFRARIAGPERLEQLCQRIIATHHLEAMGADEIEPYVRHRLSCAGWTGNPDFAPDAYDALYRFSGGVPRRLNMLAGRMLLLGSVDQLALIDGEVVEAAFADIEGRPVPELKRPVRAPAPAPEPVLVPVDSVLELEPEFAAEPVAPATMREPDTDLAAQMALLEARLDEQDKALRRVLNLLVDWVEGEAAKPNLATLRGTAAA